MLEFHPLADIFPMMDAEEFMALKADIETYGQREPITLAEGKIIDGRNRYNACMELGIEPCYGERDATGDLLAFIISKNLHRRHLNESQRAMVAARVANIRQGERTDLEPSANLQKVSQDNAAKMLATSTHSISHAKKVLTKGIPELAQTVEQGKVRVSLAAKVAEMSEEKQADFVDSVGGGERTPAQIIRQIAHAEKRAQPFPEGKFQVIYADPPWQYDSTGFRQSASAQYPTMTVKEISALPIPNLATSRTVLFLWATNPLLPEALAVMESWGFEYKTNMVWIKDNWPGMGWWVESIHELLLIGVRDDTPHPAVKPCSSFEAGRDTGHSRKPEKAYEIIESMYPGNKVELFSRSVREGWTMWGNEIEREIHTT